jgi:erythromycin esterase-like protein
MADLETAARPIDELPELVGDARIVLLGEASHGTHEFYALRAQLTRELVARHGFRGVAVEADWPAAARVNRYVQRSGDDRDAERALGDFVCFPRWMGRNGVVVELVEWLREHGAGAGFYGLDLYRLGESMTAVIACRGTRTSSPSEAGGRRRALLPRDVSGPRELVEPARHPHGGHPRRAARASRRCRHRGVGPQLARRRRARNVDGHDHGELNLGQLARERHGDAVRVVGFTTHAGTVTAARDWGDPAERRIVRPSLEGSIERGLHDAGIERGVLDLLGGEALSEPLLQRMIGVIYRPESERLSHYVHARASDQFDVLVHVDETTAPDPLEAWSAVEEPAETYPSGL